MFRRIIFYVKPKINLGHKKKLHIALFYFCVVVYRAKRRCFEAENHSLIICLLIRSKVKQETQKTMLCNIRPVYQKFNENAMKTRMK